MATIKLGGKDLDVREATIGDWKRQIRPFQDASQKTASIEEAADLAVGIVFNFVKHNEGVTREFIEDSIPVFGMQTVVSDVLSAAGLQTRKEPASGEAASQ